MLTLKRKKIKMRAECQTRNFDFLGMWGLLGGFLWKRLPRGCPAKEFVCTSVFTGTLLAQLTTGRKDEERGSEFVGINSGQRMETV